MVEKEKEKNDFFLFFLSRAWFRLISKQCVTSTETITGLLGTGTEKGGGGGGLGKREIIYLSLHCHYHLSHALNCAFCGLLVYIHYISLFVSVSLALHGKY